MIEEEMIEPCAKSQKSGRYHIVNWEKYQFVSDTDPTAPIRQKRYREKRKSNAFQTRTDTDTDTDKKKEKKHIQRSLPENWTLSEQDVVYAQSKGWAKERVTSEGERFKNYYLTNGKAHKDWHRAWCKWVTSPYQTSQKASEGNGKLNVHQAADAQLEQFRAIINGGPSRLRDGAGESNVRLLPAGRREQS
jgi:hypothetical protein